MLVCKTKDDPFSCDEDESDETKDKKKSKAALNANDYNTGYINPLAKKVSMAAWSRATAQKRETQAFSQGRQKENNRLCRDRERGEAIVSSGPRGRSNKL